MISKRFAIGAAAMALVVLLTGSTSKGTPESHTAEMLDIDCSQCHTCETPTAQNKCLKQCPSFSMTHVATSHQLSEAPDSLLLGYLADLYQPVRFDHKAHADMAEMGLKCATCHHYSPAGRIPSCRECHGGEANPNNLRQPALKGAYHRQCISCHREWSHDTKCLVCHLPAEGKISAVGVDTTDIIGVPHPVITEPAKKIYNTPFDEGPIVTFYHEQHVQLYGLRCANCHAEEACSRCHDLSRPKNRAQLTNELKSMEEVHAICNDCHADDDCGKCHDHHEKPPFSHAMTGWGLGRFHNRLDCRACHPTGRPIGRLDTRCVSCHGGWNIDNFNHAVTGLRLDEMHSEIDCEVCHVQKRFEQDPVCADCHEDDRTAHDATPGEYLR